MSRHDSSSECLWWFKNPTWTVFWFYYEVYRFVGGLRFASAKRESFVWENPVLVDPSQESVVLLSGPLVKSKSWAAGGRVDGRRSSADRRMSTLFWKLLQSATTVNNPREEIIVLLRLMVFDLWVIIFIFGGLWLSRQNIYQDVAIGEGWNFSEPSMVDSPGPSCACSSLSWVVCGALLPSIILDSQIPTQVVQVGKPWPSPGEHAFTFLETQSSPEWSCVQFQSLI